ncbi:WW domain binding protein VOPP1 isoform X3 [Narcine bancroftii]|uniref:WW domain binding protein VOPP1 isoform X3 n=1 Tax=Narcine bancroftii TaxID=1343680 RepID=UPI003831A001
MAVSPRPSSAIACLILLLLESTAAKKYCWYVDAGYPTYFICRAYEDCCGTRCCMRTFSIQRLWYFWFLLMMGVLFCCGAGFFIRRRLHPPQMTDDPPFTVGFTRQPVNTTGCQTTGKKGSEDPRSAGMEVFSRIQLHCYPYWIMKMQPNFKDNQSGMQYYTEPGAPAVNPIASSFQIQPNFPLLNPAYPPPPAYCNQPPPPYEQVVKISNKEAER